MLPLRASTDVPDGATRRDRQMKSRTFRSEEGPDSGGPSMSAGVAKNETKNEKRLFHATIHVTRLEEWCVEATSPEEACVLLQSGAGHRCHLGDLLHFEVDRMLD